MWEKLNQNNNTKLQNNTTNYTKKYRIQNTKIHNILKYQNTKFRSK